MIYHVAPETILAPRLVWPGFKRLFDLVVVGITAPVWVPALLALALVLRVVQGPGVFFVQERLGRQGRAFPMIKLRTMTRDAPDLLRTVLRDPGNALEWSARAKLANDPRCTPIGAWLRRYSLDELPQLLNVLVGHMSLIGPRPVPLAEFQTQYRGAAARAYVSLRPGLSGLWQVTARNSDYARRLRLDVAYAERRSLLLDMAILVRTVGAVLRGTGC